MINLLTYVYLGQGHAVEPRQTLIIVSYLSLKAVVMTGTYHDTLYRCISRDFRTPFTQMASALGQHKSIGMNNMFSVYIYFPIVFFCWKSFSSSWILNLELFSLRIETLFSWCSFICQTYLSIPPQSLSVDPLLVAKGVLRNILRGICGTLKNCLLCFLVLVDLNYVLIFRLLAFPFAHFCDSGTQRDVIIRIWMWIP